MRIAAPASRTDTSQPGSDELPDTLDPAQASGAPADCVERYHSALQHIKQTEFAALSATGSSSFTGGDLSLPGVLIFTPKPAPRSRAEMSALATAASLARSRGQPTKSADAQWVDQRLGSDLSDYLGQKPTPYLCGGVPQYIETLRRFAERAGNGPQRLQSLLETQTAAASRSVEAAFAAMKPVAVPHFAPEDRPSGALDDVPTGTIAGLRPAAGLSRAETTSVAKAGDTERDPADDPDLPPLKKAPPRPLATPADLTAAVDAIMASARAAGFVAPSVAVNPDLMPTPEHPVLSRLAAARESLRSNPAGDDQQSVRLQLVAAFADIEALDYLMRANGEKGDPRTLAVNATFDAILAAQEKECTCGGK